VTAWRDRRSLIIEKIMAEDTDATSNHLGRIGAFAESLLGKIGLQLWKSRRGQLINCGVMIYYAI